MTDWWYLQRSMRRMETPPSEPTPEMVAAARARVEAATARILTATIPASHGTVFAVRYGPIGGTPETYLITAAHVTNNQRDQTRGFTVYQTDDDGVRRPHIYFPIMRGNQLAFAEHVAVNPQGWVCETDDDGVIPAGAPISDLSMLRLLSPAQSLELLQRISYGPAWEPHGRHLFESTPALASYLDDQGQLSYANALRATRGFSMTPIDIDDSARNPHHRRTPTAYSVAYHRNEPDFPTSVTVNENYGDGTSLLQQFDDQNIIKGGHSGSLLYDVDETGRIIPIGVVSGTVRGENSAIAVHFSKAMEGVDAVRLGHAIRGAHLSDQCRHEPGEHPDEWLAASSLIPRAPEVPRILLGGLE